MLKRIVTGLMILIFLPLHLFAQVDDKYLVAVDLDQDVSLNSLEKLHLGVYHIFENTLIAGATDESVKSLNRLGFTFRVLDENPDNSNYYIVSRKKIGEARPVNNTQIIFDDSDSFIIKGDQPAIKKLVSNGFESVLMKKHPGIYRFENQIPQYKITASLDSVISDVVREINVDSVRNFVQSLQNFGTRFLQAENRELVAIWIHDQFEKMGYTDIVIEEFWNMRTQTWQYNVIATIQGSRDSEAVYVIGGHHDSISSGDPMTFAPGADDNASGTTAVLEIARVIMQSGYEPEATFKFVTFAAEEYGLYGSFDFAEKAYNSGMNIKLMINHDMISHTSNLVENSDVDINYYTGSEDFREMAKINTEKFTIINPENGSQNSAGSDSYSFWSYGFPAVYFEERNFSPYYHSPQDIIDNYSMEFCTEVIKASCATLISASVIPSRVENLNIVDMGDGNSLLVNWDSNSESDLVGYYIYLGTSSGIYDTVITTLDTSLYIGELTEETEYYIGIAAYDLDLFESTIVEKTGIPRSVPIAPLYFYIEPVWHAVELFWAPNLESDISGYHIYRSTADLSESPVRINEFLITDSSYVDSSVENVIYYNYVITAVDLSQNESLDSDTVKSRAISLDQGVLVVDETADGSGTILSPTDNEVDEFFDSLLNKFYSYNFDVIALNGINLADLGAYSTIIWHGNDYVDLATPLESKIDIQKYLEYGGNLVFTGYLPSLAFEGNQTYPRDYAPGDFLYDYLKISHLENSFGSRFVGAIPLSEEYTEIYTDINKTPENVNHHLPRIEGIGPAPQGTAIYQYDTYFDSTTVAGNMKGETVGVAYFGDDFKVVTLSFPLYYMQEDQAKNLIFYILNEQFNELLTIEKREDIIATEFRLLQNYPNPFNPTTKIHYELQFTNDVDLSIYNLLGEKIATLVSENQKAGYHQVEWDASNFASGVYYYSLKAGEFRDVKKMVLIK